MADKTKLIEVALPLEVINRESAREKSIRKGHPSTLHIWWARRPLAATRAVLFAQLVDDPISNPELFPTTDDQKRERERLHKLIERLAVWENIHDKGLYREAYAEILKSTNGNPPPVLDPFAGGGSIPLEAQRLGLVAKASDLNPVAVLINKALIEIPPKFKDRKPIWPGLAASETAGWPAARGLAADVDAYGKWMRDEAEKRVGHLYPQGALPNSDAKVNVIAWIWAGTVTCPNPACKSEVPLVPSMWLSKKKGRERWLKPMVVGNRVEFEVGSGPKAPASNKTGQGARFTCWVCGTPIDANEVHEQIDVVNKPRPRLLAVVIAGDRKREYVTPSTADLTSSDEAALIAAQIRGNDDFLLQPARGTFGGNAQGRRYGFFTFADYFTDRQLVALTTFSDLVEETRDKAERDAQANGLPIGQPLDCGGADAAAYADAIAIYLTLWLGRILNRSTSLNIWNTIGEKTEQLFARNAAAAVTPVAGETAVPPGMNVRVFGSRNTFGDTPVRYVPDLTDPAPAAAAQAAATANAVDANGNNITITGNDNLVDLDPESTGLTVKVTGNGNDLTLYGDANTLISSGNNNALSVGGEGNTLTFTGGGTENDVRIISKNNTVTFTGDGSRNSVNIGSLSNSNLVTLAGIDRVKVELLITSNNVISYNDVSNSGLNMGPARQNKGSNKVTVRNTSQSDLRITSGTGNEVTLGDSRDGRIIISGADNKVTYNNKTGFYVSIPTSGGTYEE